MPVSNRQISKLFKLGAALLELHNENQFKVRSYEIAAQLIRAIPEPLVSMNEKQLEEIQGVGKNLSKKILQIRDTGSYEELERLMQLTPPGVLEMLQIKGFGAKKVRAVWQELAITSPEELLQACEADRVKELRGFGKKTQDNIRDMVHFFFESKGKYLYAEAEGDAVSILSYLKEHPFVENVAITGEMRRKMPVVSRIDFLVALKQGRPEDLRDENDEYIISDNGELRSANVEAPLHFHTADKENWITELILTTGNEKHLERVDLTAASGAGSEKDAYQKINLPYIIPEMREGRNEFDIVPDIREEDIIQLHHLKGCLHNHSTWSDGSKSIEDMAVACRELGLEYFGISDHSQAAFYANGLKPQAVISQMKEVDKLNEKLKPFRIFKGIEADILSTGKLDYDEDTLDLFDFVVASVHSNLKMNEQEATQRLIKAIENPYTTFLRHMTGRLLLMRAGYPVDHKRVIDACADNGVIIEINANPRRLDMDWQWIHYAVQKGVMLSINPDGHDDDEIQNMYYGVCVARKAGLTHDMVLNTYPVEEVEKFFHKKKSNRP